VSTLPLLEELTLTHKELNVNIPTVLEARIALGLHSLCNDQPGSLLWLLVTLMGSLVASAAVRMQETEKGTKHTAFCQVLLYCKILASPLLSYVVRVS